MQILIMLEVNYGLNLLTVQNANTYVQISFYCRTTHSSVHNSCTANSDATSSAMLSLAI